MSISRRAFFSHLATGAAALGGGALLADNWTIRKDCDAPNSNQNKASDNTTLCQTDHIAQIAGGSLIGAGIGHYYAEKSGFDTDEKVMTLAISAFLGGRIASMLRPLQTGKDEKTASPPTSEL